MTEAVDLQALAGNSIESSDRADSHRLAGYRRFFALEEREPELALHWLLFTGLSAETREDGHPAVMAPFPLLPYPRRMWAGGEVRWLSAIQRDEPLVRLSTIVKADLKSGTAGDFLLAALSHRISGGDQVRIEERQDIVFLPAATRPGSAPPRPCAFEPQWEESRSFGPVALFRYSALTLNSHRIHYDADYAVQVEHYAGLVVHGPLLASHVLHAAARRRSAATPVRFTYRAVAPSFAGEALRIVGTDADAASELAILGQEGDLRFTATLSFAE